MLILRFMLSFITGQRNCNPKLALNPKPETLPSFRSGAASCDGLRFKAGSGRLHSSQLLDSPRRACHCYIHAYMHTYIHTYIHAYMHAYIHTYMHTCIHAYMHTCIHAYIHMYTYIHICTCPGILLFDIQCHTFNAKLHMQCESFTLHLLCLSLNPIPKACIP